jgi:hypothetical protein
LSNKDRTELVLRRLAVVTARNHDILRVQPQKFTFSSEIEPNRQENPIPLEQYTQRNNHTPLIEFGGFCIIFAQHKYYEHTG